MTNEIDPADIIAGALQISRGHAYEIMRRAVEEEWPPAQETAGWLVEGGDDHKVYAKAVYLTADEAKSTAAAFTGHYPVVKTAELVRKQRAHVTAQPVHELDVDAASMLRLIETIRYMTGIAERGEGRKCRDDEKPEQFLLNYVKRLEAQPAQALEDLSGVRACCGEYAKCHRPCTPRGAWQASQAQPAQELTDEQKQEIHNQTGAGHALICLVESYVRGARSAVVG